MFLNLNLHLKFSQFTISINTLRLGLNMHYSISHDQGNVDFLWSQSSDHQPWPWEILNLFISHCPRSHVQNSPNVSIHNSDTYLNQMPKHFNGMWLSVDPRLKPKKTMCLNRDWTTCSKYAKHFNLNNRHI